MFNIHDRYRDQFMLNGPFAYEGYDWWWHSFTGTNIHTGERKAFFVEFFTINPAQGGNSPVFGQLPKNKRRGIEPSYVMVKAGCWGEDHTQLHRFFGWKEVKIHHGIPFSIQAKDCSLSEFHTEGKIEMTEEEAKAHPEWMSDAGSMSWNLSIDKKIPFNVGYGASKLFRDIKAFEMYWHAEGMKTEYLGTVCMNGQRYRIDPKSSYGYADKNWGRNFTSPWIWLSSNNLRSRITGKQLDNSVFDIGGGRPKVYFVPLNKKLLGALYYEGRQFEYNFSKFWMAPETRFRCTETEDEIIWKVNQANATSMIKVEVRCKKKDMLLVNYESPDGMKRHNRLWNGGNGVGRILLYKKTPHGLVLIDDIRAMNVGCEYGEYDR